MTTEKVYALSSGKRAFVVDNTILKRFFKILDNLLKYILTK